MMAKHHIQDGKRKPNAGEENSYSGDKFWLIYEHLSNLKNTVEDKVHQVGDSLIKEELKKDKHY